MDKITQNHIAAFNQLVDLGYQPYIAAGIVGNLHQESNLNPTVENQTVKGPNKPFGVAQWTNDRKQALFNYANHRGTSPSDLSTQVSFLNHELHSSEASARAHLLKTNNATDAALSFRKNYERSGDAEANDKRRIGMANKILNFIIPSAYAEDMVPYDGEVVPLENDNMVPYNGEVVPLENERQPTASQPREEDKQPQANQPTISPGTSAGAGLMSGATFGINDEVDGVINALTDKAMDTYADIVGNPQAKTGRTFEQNYMLHRDEVRKQQELAQQQHPGMYDTGNLVGGVSTSILPIGAIGTTVSNATKAVPVISKVAKLASSAPIAGALSGGAIEYANNSNPDTVLQDTVKGAITGAVTGLGFSLLGRLVQNGLFTNAHEQLQEIAKRITPNDEQLKQLKVAGTAAYNALDKGGKIILNPTRNSNLISEVTNTLDNFDVPNNIKKLFSPLMEGGQMSFKQYRDIEEHTDKYLRIINNSQNKADVKAALIHLKSSLLDGLEASGSPELREAWDMARGEYKKFIQARNAQDLMRKSTNAVTDKTNLKTVLTKQQRDRNSLPKQFNNALDQTKTILQNNEMSGVPVGSSEFEGYRDLVRRGVNMMTDPISTRAKVAVEQQNIPNFAPNINADVVREIETRIAVAVRKAQEAAKEITRAADVTSGQEKVKRLLNR